MIVSSNTAAEVGTTPNRTEPLQLVALGAWLFLACFAGLPLKAQTVAATVAVGVNPDAIAVNPRTNKIYVGNFYGTPVGITVIDGKTNTTKGLTTITGQVAVAVNPFTNKIYFVDGYNNLTVVDGSSDTVTDTVTVGMDPVAVAVNPVSNMIYVANQTGSSVSVIDGSNDTVKATLNLTGGPNLLQGFIPSAIYVNPVTNKIYVTCQSADMLIDGTTNNVTQLAYTGGLVGGGPIGVNPVTNTLFAVQGGNSTVLVIDASTNALSTTVSTNLLAPLDVALNPVTNTAYVLNTLIEDVAAIDGTTYATTLAQDSNANGPIAVTVNPSTNQIFVANSKSNNVTVINGTAYATTLAAGTNPVAIASNPVTNTVYVANYGSNNVTVIAGTGTPQSIPLTTTITPFSGNQTSSTSPTFTFAAASTFAPTAPPVQAVYFQVDSEQGAWTQAANNGSGNFSGSAALSNGSHTLYAFATDGQDATSTITGVQSSPLIGSIASYSFSVSGSGPAFSASPSPVAFGNQTQGTTSSAKTLTVTNTGTTSLSITNVAEGGANMADFPVSSDTCMGATVAAGSTCTLSVKFSPTTAAAESATLTFTDNASGSPHAVNLTGTGVAVVQTATTTALSASATTVVYGTSVTFTATVTPTSGTPTPTGTVTFKDGSTTLGTGSLNGSGVATYSTTTLALGAHSVTASYGGDTLNLGSVSSALSVGVTVIGTATSPTFTPAAGTYTGTQSVTIADSTPGAMIYYTTDSSTPPASSTSTLYSGPVSVASSETINAIAVAPGYTNSAVVSAAYVINAVPPTYAMTVSPSTLTIQDGQSGTTTITVTPQNGFNSSVSFACSGLTLGVTCAFGSPTLTPSGTAAVTTPLTISTFGAPGNLARNRTPNPLIPGGTLALALCLVGWRKRRGILQLVLLLAIGIAGLSMLNGCGGSHSRPHTTALIVQSSSGNIQQNASLTVIVNY